MSSAGPRRIVGTATFPSIGQVHSDHTSLGVGAMVVSEEVPGYARNTGRADGAALPPGYGPNVLFVRFRQGADKGAVIERLNTTAPGLGDTGGITVVSVQRSAEIVNSDNISGSSMLLGIAVAVSALASLAIALTAAVRRRRRDLALLKALGFTRRQLSATVAWQATSTTIVGLLVGVPLGVVFGRVLWVQFAGQLDVLAEPSVPLTAIGIVAAVALVAANILAALPARYARAVAPSLVLRAE
jgi:ABC-type antimicrobial peptide transport system permease subunit